MTTVRVATAAPYDVEIGHGVLDRLPRPPAVFILRMRLVPLIDASGVTALRQFLSRCERLGTRVILSGLREQPRRVLAQMQVSPDGSQLRFADGFAQAIEIMLRVMCVLERK